MCRHLGWLGRPRTLADLLLDRPHGLLQQSWAPRRQRHGTVNADGWGVGWYSPASPEPARWRGDRPVWADASFASVAPHVSAGCVLAAVRSASVGMPVDTSSAAPFVRGRWSLSHNGIVDRGVLPAAAWAAAESVCDAAVLAAHLLGPGDTPTGPEQLGARVAAVGALDPHARLNVLATDGEQLVATTWGDTLSVLSTDDGVVLASEPYDDDPRWTDVPDRTLVTVTATGVSTTALPA